MFSDSIFIASNDNSSQSLYDVAYSAANILVMALMKGVPIKGALAYGKTTVDTTNEVFFGQAIVDANSLQDNLKYYGIVAHYTIEEYIKDVKLFSEKDEEKIFNIFFSSKTKTKSGDIHYKNIDWFGIYNVLSRGSENYDQSIYDLMNNLAETVSGDPRIYIDNTIEMYNRLSEISEKIGDTKGGNNNK